ncbi:MAG: hypothetical protein U0984_01410 [Prosthecobacter sp.]|nr:hypothetical protein [Prosthecobacter sp.]
MPAPYSFRSCLVIGLFLVPMIGLIGCTKKAELQRQIEEKQVAWAEQKARLAELQKKFAATPMPSKSTVTRPNLIHDLQVQIKGVEEEIDRLKARKAEVETLNQNSQRKIDEYLARSAKP